MGVRWINCAGACDNNENIACPLNCYWWSKHANMINVAKLNITSFPRKPMRWEQHDN